jgi:predicted extracellular nuclease
MKNILLVVLLVMAVAMSATTIYDVQYTTDAGNDGTYPSSMAGQEVTVTGIVTAINADGDKFFISDPEGGAWKGIYVFDWSVSPQIGDMVEVTGTVTEYYGLTELSYCSCNIISSGNVAPNPMIVTTGQLADGEQYEGVLIKVIEVEAVTASDQYGKFKINDGTGEAHVNDLFDVYPEPEAGDVFSSITGMGHYDYGTYTIEPRTLADAVESTPVSNSGKSWGKIKSIYK